MLEARQELTGADRAWAEQYERGDVLRYSRGSTVLGVNPGEYVAVASIDAQQNLLTVKRADGRDMTYDPRRLQGVSVYRAVERDFAERDRIQFTAPSRELHVANRELGTVVRIHASGDMAIHTDSGRLVEFNLKDHPHLDYGYAVTSHSSQGQTSDRALVHVDTQESAHLVNSRMAYVAISRGRYDAQIYTNDKSELAEHLSREVSRDTAIETGQNDRSDGRRVAPSSLSNYIAQDHAHSNSQSHAWGGGQGRAMGSAR